MQKHISLTNLAAVALAACVSTSALAQESGQRQVYQSSASAPTQTGLYLGVSVGQQTTKLQTALETDSGLKYSVLGGFRFNRNLRLEGSVSNTAKVKIDDNTSSKISGFDVGVLGSADLADGVAVYGKIGVAHNEMKWNTAPALGVATSQSSTNLLLGTGFIFDISKVGELRLSFEHVSVGDNKVVSGHANALSVATVFKF
jgi:opacity protein-like surface antigen